MVEAVDTGGYTVLDFRKTSSAVWIGDARTRKGDDP
jgi:hypothetical protein